VRSSHRDERRSLHTLRVRALLQALLACVELTWLDLTTAALRVHALQVLGWYGRLDALGTDDAPAVTFYCCNYFAVLREQITQYPLATCSPRGPHSARTRHAPSVCTLLTVAGALCVCVCRWAAAYASPRLTLGTQYPVAHWWRSVPTQYPVAHCPLRAHCPLTAWHSVHCRYAKTSDITWSCHKPTAHTVLALPLHSVHARISLTIAAPRVPQARTTHTASRSRACAARTSSAPLSTWRISSGAAAARSTGGRTGRRPSSTSDRRAVCGGVVWLGDCRGTWLWLCVMKVCGCGACSNGMLPTQEQEFVCSCERSSAQADGAVAQRRVQYPE
jgi:hypothetical protein